MLTPGIRKFETDDTIEVFLDPQLLLVFDGQGRSVTNYPPLAA
jgi:glycerol transport system ATP-binding protein